ncbi:MAG TPA: protein kinase, partial [Thermoanaerobaculia bacterium]|nr:protein kinase [Thermoanaerobaculia bacterium]
MRARFPLLWKLFGLTAILILIVVGIATAITVQNADRVASTTVRNSISSAARLFRDLEKQRLADLALPAVLLGNDPTFVAYIQEALGGGAAVEQPADSGPAAVGTPPPAPTPAVDYASVADQLEQRRQSFDTDLIMLLDDEGRLVARTDQPTVVSEQREDLYERSPLVKRIVDDPAAASAAGVMPLGKALYHVAVAPIAVGQPRVRVGYLVNAYAIDDEFANQIAQTTNAGVMFVGTSGDVERSSEAPSVGMQQMKEVAEIFRTGKAVPPSDVEIENSKYIMTGQPLVAGERVTGAAVFLRSLDRELMPFKEIERGLFTGGLISLVLALVLSWLIARRLTRPIEQLAGMTQAVTAGDYDVHPDFDRSDEIGILAKSFAQMISSLRDKAELEQLYSQMASRAEEREPAGRPHLPPALNEGTVLVTDLRGLAVTADANDAAAVIDRVGRIMRLQEAEVRRQEGVVREIIGHRLISLFTGERGIIRAIRAARAINEELATDSEGDAGVAVGAGIATGEFVTGSVDLSEVSGTAIVGNAPLLALLCAWHAPNGQAYVSYESAQAASAEVLSKSSREEIAVRWLPQPLPVAALPLVNLSATMMKTYAGGSADATLRMDAASGPATGPAAATVDLRPGQTFASRYRIEQTLGRGGMGVVYRATDTQLDETVAIKTLPGDVMQKSPEDLERFKREIRLARKITHRNVLRTYDYGEAEGLYFISMEFVRGYTLAEMLEETGNKQMPPRLALGVARQICRGLQAAHEQGVVHRDIKPQNVLIDAKGEVKLMDFGIARMAEAKDAMTQAGLIIGT